MILLQRVRKIYAKRDSAKHVNFESTPRSQKWFKFSRKNWKNEAFLKAIICKSNLTKKDTKLIYKLQCKDFDILMFHNLQGFGSLTTI